MRHALLPLVMFLALGADQALAAPVSELGNRPPIKLESGSVKPRHITPMIAGETYADAIPIPGIPFTVTGNSCNYSPDIIEACGGTGPDLVYSFTPAADMCVTISLCSPMTTFDTILNLLAGPGPTLVACNDDNCGLQSEIANVSLAAGQTYYIVVDGYGGDCGDYELTINECPPPCQFACPAGSIPEGEPNCYDGYVDVFNAGCNSDPPTYTILPCAPSVTVCGTYGTYVDPLNGPTRDTDWYAFSLTGTTTITATAIGQATTALAIVDLTQGCDLLGLSCGINVANPCESTTCSATLPAGDYAIFVSTSAFSGVPCGSVYALTVSGMDCPTPGARPSWGQVKVRYR